jgi:transcriptional regulator with XRE-family HTH domain
MVDEDERPANLLGEVIRQQRELAALPLRQLASLVGISNPYLSQIEHGLRAPSREVLESIAGTLRIPLDAFGKTVDDRARDASSEDATYREDRQPEGSSLVPAMRADPALTPQQRRALVEIYAAMVDVTAARRKRRGAPG